MTRLIIDDDGLFWGDRPIDSLAASHLDMALYPKAVALTVWTFVNFLFKQTAQDVAKALGLGAPPPPETTWQSVALDRMREQGALAAPGDSPPAGQNSRESRQVPVQTAGGDMFGTPFGGESQVDPRIQAALQAASMTFSKKLATRKAAPESRLHPGGRVGRTPGQGSCHGRLRPRVVRPQAEEVHGHSNWPQALGTAQAETGRRLRGMWSGCSHLPGFV